MSPRSGPHSRTITDADEKSIIPPNLWHPQFHLRQRKVHFTSDDCLGAPWTQLGSDTTLPSETYIDLNGNNNLAWFPKPPSGSTQNDSLQKLSVQSTASKDISTQSFARSKDVSTNSENPALSTISPRKRNTSITPSSTPTLSTCGTQTYPNPKIIPLRRSSVAAPRKKPGSGKESKVDATIQTSCSTITSGTTVAALPAGEVWENLGSTCIPLASSASQSKKNYYPKSRFSYSLGRTLRGARSTESESCTNTAAGLSRISSRNANLLSSSLSTLMKGLSSEEFSSAGSKTHQTANTVNSDDLREASHVFFPTSRMRRKHMPHLQSVIDELKKKEVVFDRQNTMKAMQKRILRGEKVTYEEIRAIKQMRLPPEHRHVGWRLPWSRDLFCVKGLVHIPTPNKQSPEMNTFGTMDDLRMPLGEDITMEHWGRRHYVLNLEGFLDEDISLYLEGKNRLVIRAVRPEVDNNPPAIVTETIILPPDLSADNLRIVRKPSGTTIIEESWRF